MDKFLYCPFAYAILLITYQIPCVAKSLATDQSSLFALKAHIISDPHRILTRNWTNSSSVCNWIGVTCNLRRQRVAALNVSNMHLSGTIPPHLGNLSFLVSLDLGFNLFEGSLPQALSLLHRLKFISLRNNSFTGYIPNTLSNLSNLQYLDFRFNSLRGEIPTEYGMLPSLQFLRMDYNHLSHAIPSALFNISTLKVIGLTSNELSGRLPVDTCRNLEGILLSLNQLSGQIPSNISHCSQLLTLSLSYNSFTGQIPPQIGNIITLQRLYLGGNNLNGAIPQEIGNLHNVVEFDIEKNQITGPLPLKLFNLSSLQYLHLWRNKLTGNLSGIVGNLTMLRNLQLMENNFTGVLPREITQLYHLEVVGLDFNTFTGSIPLEFFNISTLQILSLSYNGFIGALPTNLCDGLPSLEEFFIGGNYLYGAIPDSLSNCSQLTDLSLSYNNFSGFVPQFLGSLRFLEILELTGNNLETSSSVLSFITSLTSCRSLTELSFDDNPLQGVIPASIGNLSNSLQNFFASDCEIIASIPPDIGNLSSLILLDLSNNMLSGNIPLAMRQLHELQGLYLSNNKMEGPILEGLCDLHSLNSLVLSLNKFSGPIPECVGNISSLGGLYLGRNKLTSTIPSSLWFLEDLLNLGLSSNALTGLLPPEIGNLVSTSYINLSMNQLSGPIPQTIGNLKKLVNLSLAHNKLEGPIPMSVGSLISVVTLDFSYNNLSGPLPKSMEALQYLSYFNVSFNGLSGEIPSGGPFRNFTSESFMANEALCGIPKFHVPVCHTNFSNGSRKKLHHGLFILIGVVALIVFILLALIFLSYKRKDNTTSTTDVLVSNGPERISYYEILQATEQLSERNLLGEGSFGSVYKGILPNGKAFAVKVFNIKSEAGLRSFDVECEVLRNIRHRNLTKVITSCSNEDFMALVLEYMPNGNLEKWLYSSNYFLDVRQRLNIMIDVASALEYLHYGYSTPIVHCDLKPSNILLDDDMNAHLSDFGIAKLLGDGESIVITNTLATLGYIAPEYGMEGLISTRCDVYSYGVMLMETFTRKRPSDDMFDGVSSLKSWVESSLPHSSYQVIDDKLLMNLEEDHTRKIVQCVSSILVLALKCSAEFPNDRKNIKEALAELNKIRSQFSR